MIHCIDVSQEAVDDTTTVDDINYLIADLLPLDVAESGNYKLLRLQTP